MTTPREPLPSSPPEAWEPRLRLTRLAGRPLERFLEIEAEWCVNDALMAIFFFVGGLAIRREIHHGELSERRQTLPAGLSMRHLVVVGAVASVGVTMALFIGADILSTRTKYPPNMSPCTTRSGSTTTTSTTSGASRGKAGSRARPSSST